MTDFRALCAELLEALENAIRVIYYEDSTKHISTANPVITRARAALDQTESQELTHKAAARNAVESCQAQREEVLTAFIAKHGFCPDEAIQIEQRQGDGSTTWRIERRTTPAQPEPEGPTNKEIDELALELLDGDRASTRDFARAVLARFGRPAVDPVVLQGASEKEWDGLRAHFERILCDALSSGGPVVGNIALADHLINAVYARWGRPAIEPVPVSERLPGPGDCLGRPFEETDAGFCWWFYPGLDGWRFMMAVHWVDGAYQKWTPPGTTHWLPHYALPVPQQEVE